VKIRAAGRLSRWGTLGLIVCSLSACERKAPSPEQCQEFAMRGLGIKDQRQLDLATVKDRFDAVVVKCLTTPYDKELLRCIQARSAAKSCILEFEAREERRGLPVSRQ
jgi:hypothetical protein